MAGSRGGRKVLHYGGVRGVLAESPGGWMLANEDDVQARTETDASEWVLAWFRAIVATLDAGLVDVSDVGRLNKQLKVIESKPTDELGYVSVPDDLLAGVAYVCACLANWNGSEWLAWILTERLDANLFKGWPLEPGRTPDDQRPSVVAAGSLMFVVSGRSTSEVLEGMPAMFWERLSKHAELRIRVVTAATDPFAAPDALERLASFNDEAVLYAVASHPNTSAEMLRRIGTDPSNPEEARLAVARNLQASPALLLTLAQDRSDDVRSVAAAHPAMPARVLAHLAADPWLYVRAAVALHPSTPEQVLTYAVYHDYPFVQHHAAANPSLPPAALEILLSDSSRHRRAEAVLHSNTSVEMVLPLATDRSFEVRRRVAHKPGMPAEILDELARDLRPEVRAAVAWNANTTQQTLDALATDKDALVRSAAEAARTRSDMTPEDPMNGAYGEDPDDAASADAGSSSDRRPSFVAQPPGEGVSKSEWARAFLEAQSPNPAVRQRGRDALTAMGCQWRDLSETPSAPTDGSSGHPTRADE